METLPSDKQEIVVPTRDSLAEYRGCDIWMPLRRPLANFFKTSVSGLDLTTPEGDYYVTNAPGDPKTVFSMIPPWTPTLIGDTPDYQRQHGKSLPELSDSGAFSDRFRSIADEIMQVFDARLGADGDNIMQELRFRQDGVRFSLDFLQCPLGVLNTSDDIRNKVSERQEFFIDKRDSYLSLLEKNIKENLERKLLQSQVLTSSECLNVSIGVDSKVGKFVEFKIVQKPLSRHDLENSLVAGGGLLD